MITKQMIAEASRRMEAELSIQDIIDGLVPIQENIKFLKEEASLISMPVYLQLKAAETAALAAISRLVGYRGLKMPQKAQ